MKLILSPSSCCLSHFLPLLASPRLLLPSTPHTRDSNKRDQGRESVKEPICGSSVTYENALLLFDQTSKTTRENLHVASDMGVTALTSLALWLTFPPFHSSPAVVHRFISFSLPFQSLLSPSGLPRSLRRSSNNSPFVPLHAALFRRIPLFSAKRLCQLDSLSFPPPFSSLHLFLFPSFSSSMLTGQRFFVSKFTCPHRLTLLASLSVSVCGSLTRLFIDTVCTYLSRDSRMRRPVPRRVVTFVSYWAFC